jgi:hypothetical protein
MRAIAGLLGKTDKDGGTDRNPIARLISHLNGALAKPAADERLIFIDLNAEPELEHGQKPTWADPALGRLEQYEVNELPEGVSAYVFVTNMAFHRRLSDVPVIVAAPFGLGIPDFNKPGMMRLTEAYRRKQKHIDAHHIGDAFAQFVSFPSTFDGSLPSEAFGSSPPRVTIGETYHFENIGDRGLIGTVSSAVVIEKEKQAYIGVNDAQGNAHILRQPISEQELADYKAHPEAYFGKIMPVSKGIQDRYGLFEWLMEAYKELPRATLLERVSKAPNFDVLKSMSDSELRAEYCEAMVATYEQAGFNTNPTKKAG